MSPLTDVLDDHVGDGAAPGAVALAAQGDRVEVATCGWADVGRTTPMRRDSIFRIASITKPITAAAVMLLVDDGRIALDSPVGEWLPEIEAPMVVREPASPVDDVVAARRPITVEDLLTFRAGYGFGSDFALPAVGLLFSELAQGPPEPDRVAAPDSWMSALSHIPMLAQPGDAWLYNTCSDIAGVLVARVAGQSFAEFLAERVFEPLGMVDTGFWVPQGAIDRFTSCYRPTSAGPQLVDAPTGRWSRPPDFKSGAGGLVATVDDWWAFGRMLLDGGTVRGRRLLSAKSVREMTTNHLTKGQRDASQLFLEGQGWGFGGAVDIDARDPWNVPGRYGWVGGTGMSAHIIPSTGTVAVLMTQLEMKSPTPPEVMRAFWRYTANG